jgi:hypothetical protein
VPDKKWDRFKRLFKIEVSDDLIDVRKRKIEDARAEAATAIQRLRDKGLNPGLHAMQLTAFDRSYLAALRLGSNQAISTALQPVKDNMRALAARAREDAEARVSTLATDLSAVRFQVQGTLDRVTKTSHPVLRAAMSLPYADVYDAQQDAESKAKDEQKRAALAAIKLEPLRKALGTIQKGETSYKLSTKMLGVVDEHLALLFDTEEKVGWARRRRILDQRHRDVADLNNVEGVILETQSIAQALNQLILDMGDAVRRDRKLRKRADTVTEAIDALAKRARAIDHESGKAIVASELQSVLDKRKDALAKDTPALVADALEDIDLKTLQMAIVASQDLDLGCPQLIAALPRVLTKADEGDARSELFETVLTLTGDYKDLKAVKDLAEAKRGFKTLKAKLTKAMDDALKLGGEGIYEEALEARFGVTITKSDGALVNLKQTYEMMSLVPESHVGQEMCAKVNFTHKSDHGASYSKSVINMDDFEEGYTYTYTPDGGKQKVNAFNVCMLHEIGHSIDDKYDIMDGVMATPGYGDWRSESRDSVLDAFTSAALVAMRAVAELSHDHDATVRDALYQAITSGTVPERIDGTSKAQHKALVKLAGWAGKIRASEKPWFNGSITSMALNGRVYLQSYSHEWSSYAVSERQRASVRNYQWRAPGEWFADLYGYCWVKEQPPPAGVGVRVKEWFPTA